MDPFNICSVAVIRFRELLVAQYWTLIKSPSTTSWIWKAKPELNLLNSCSNSSGVLHLTTPKPLTDSETFRQTGKEKSRQSRTSRLERKQMVSGTGIPNRRAVLMNSFFLFIISTIRNLSGLGSTRWACFPKKKVERPWSGNLSLTEKESSQITFLVWGKPIRS